MSGPLQSPISNLRPLAPLWAAAVLFLYRGCEAGARSSPLDPRSEGANSLLKQGATPVPEAADVITAIEPILGRSIELSSAQEPSQELLGASESVPGSDERSRLIALLGAAPVSIDDLVRLSHSSATNVRSVLLEL